MSSAVVPMQQWVADHGWQRRFLPDMRRIVGEYLVVEAPLDEDRQRNTDLIVLRLEAVRIACRVRRWSYHAKYGDQFTIRTARPSGTETELAKLLSGWGDYILYAFADEAESSLAAWVLGDLRVFRLWFQRECVRLPAGQLPGWGKENQDESSSFRAFTIDSLPAEFVVGRHVVADVFAELPF